MGLIGGVARTAVIAGTATAVGNRVSRRQANRWSQKDQAASAQSPPPQQYQPRYGQQRYPQPAPQYAQPQYAQPQYAQPQYVQPAPPPAAPAPAAPPDMLEQLRQLAELRDQGILTEQEFSEQKARILAS